MDRVSNKDAIWSHEIANILWMPVYTEGIVREGARPSEKACPEAYAK